MRTASALVLGSVALFCLWTGGWAWRFFINFMLLGLGLEWAMLDKSHRAGAPEPAADESRPSGLNGVLLKRLRSSRWQVALIFFFLMVASNLAVWQDIPLALILLAGGAIVTGVFFDAFAGAGIPYAGLGGISLLWLRLQPTVGLIDTLYLILVIWGTDIGAYAVGRLLGGPRLAPQISPGKTWTGALGGLIIGAGAGAVFAAFLHSGPQGAFGTGLLLSLCAQGGDLLESAIKRKLGVKDSGRTIPGHGGLFDRLDGFLAASPVAALLAYFVQGGVPLWR